jgi:hypothetical protein
VRQDFNAGPSLAMDASFVQAAIAAPYIPGGYTRLLIGDDQNAVRKLHFDGVQEKWIYVTLVFCC